MQSTLKQDVTFTGVGLHSGNPVVLRVRPARADAGILFRRTDVTNADPVVLARWDVVTSTRLCTLLANDDGVTVSTVEHLMAALAGCGISNAQIDIDGPEVPILDGSAAPYVAAFLQAGIVEQNRPARIIEVLREVEASEGLAWARLSPADDFVIDYRIDFQDAAIGQQHKVLNMANGTFVRELSDSRTFCRFADIEAMHSAGLALGGDLDNAVVVDGSRILTPGGLRHADEPVRHKMLDALGDLALAGAPIHGRFTTFRGGHALTNTLLRVLFSDENNYRIVEAGPAHAGRLPGQGLTWSDLSAVA